MNVLSLFDGMSCGCHCGARYTIKVKPYRPDLTHEQAEVILGRQINGEIKMDLQ